MKVILIAISFMLILSACGSNNHKQQANASPERNRPTPKVNAGTKTDSNYFDRPVAVLVHPSLRLIEKVKKTMPQDDFYVIADDASYYQAEAGRFLDSVKTQVVYRQSEGMVRFKAESGKIFTVKLDTVFFKAILFNGVAKPFSSNMVVIDQDYNTYMKNAARQ